MSSTSSPSIVTTPTFWAAQRSRSPSTLVFTWLTCGRITPRPFGTIAFGRRSTEGHIRRRLYPARPSLPKALDIWLVDEHRHSAESTVSQAAFDLTDTADSWFAAFGNRVEVLSVLRGVTAPPDEMTWLPGAPDSAARNTAVGYLALALGERSTAAEHLRRALEQFQGFDAQNAKISRRSERMIPRHLEDAVAMLSGDST